MSSRYVELPNGSYLEWPEGVSAATFKAKATKLMGGQSSAPNRVNESMGKVTGISAYHPKTGLAGIEEKLGDWRQQLSEFANKGAGSYKVGNTSEIGDFMASAPLGVMRAAKGASEVPQGKVWEGVKDVVGGGMEAMTMPSMFIAPERSAASKVAPVEVKAAAKILTDAVNPLPKQMAGFEKALGEQLEKVITYAQSKGLNISSPEELSRAMKETGDWIRGHYYEKILGPVKDRVTSIAGTVKGYGGETAASPSSATLGQLDSRLSQINAELNPKYAKGGIAGQAAVKSAAELNAEAATIRKVLYQELAKATGLTPDVIADTRKAFGSLDSLAEQAGSAASKTRYAGNVAARQPVTVNPFGASGKQFVLDKAISAVRGNPIAKAMRNAISKVESSPYRLPEANPIAEAAKIRTPLRGTSQPLGEVATPSAKELAAGPKKVDARRMANEVARKKAELEKAQAELDRITKSARHPFWKDPRGPFETGGQQ